MGSCSHRCHNQAEISPANGHQFPIDYHRCRLFCHKLTRFKRALASVPPPQVGGSLSPSLEDPPSLPTCTLETPTGSPGTSTRLILVTAQKIAHHTQFKKMSPVWVLGGNVQPFERVSGAGVLGAITISRAGDCALALVLWARTRVCFTLPQMATRPPPT